VFERTGPGVKAGLILNLDEADHPGEDRKRKGVLAPSAMVREVRRRAVAAT
jgi:hypothetical protein